MFITTDYYTLSTQLNTITVVPNWNNLNGTTDLIILSVYRCNDKYLTEVINTAQAIYNQSVSLTVEDGCYKIVVQITCRNDCGITHNYHTQDIYFNRFHGLTETMVKDRLIKLLCECKMCNRPMKDKCDECKDSNVCNNLLADYININSMLFILFNNDEMFMYKEYMLSVFGEDYDYISSFIRDSIYKGFVKGDFEVNVSIMYKMLAATYIYLMLSESFNSGQYFTNSLQEINDFATIYNYQVVKECIEKHGINVSELIGKFRNTVYMGTYITLEDNCSNADVCPILPSIVNDYKNFKYNKEKFENGFNITIGENLEHVIFIIPKIYGYYIRIFDDMQLDISDQFDRTNYDKFFIFTSKNKYSNTTLNIKFEIR